MADLRLGVVGAGGRMGQAVIQQINYSAGVVLKAACDRPGSEFIGQDAGEVAGVGHSGIEIGDSPENVFECSEGCGPGRSSCDWNDWPIDIGRGDSGESG